MMPLLIWLLTLVLGLPLPFVRAQGLSLPGPGPGVKKYAPSGPIVHVTDRVPARVDGGSDTVTLAAFTPGAGHLLVVTIKMYTASPISAVVTDNVNAGAYTQAFVKPITGDLVQGVLQFYKNNVAAASTSVTINPNGATFHHMQAVVSEYSGQDTSANVLDPASTSGSVTSTAPSLTTAATTQASNAVVAAVSWSNVNTTLTPGAGYTQIVEQETTYPFYGGVMRQVTTVAGAVTVSWTASPAIDANMAVGIYRGAP